MIRVLQEVATMDAGGVERLLYDYYNNLGDSAIAFDFVIFDREKEGIFEKPLREKGCRFHCVPRVKGFGLDYIRALWKILRDGRYEVVHAHRGSRSFVVVFLAWAAGVPVRIVHSHVAFEPDASAVKHLKTVVFKRLCRLFATDLFACGDDAARFMWGTSDPEKVRKMTNAIDTERFRRALAARDEMRASLGVGGKFVLGTVARIDQQKNPMYLLRVAQAVQQSGRESVLLIAGTGPMEQEVKRKAREMGLEGFVRFLGVRQDIPELLAAMDLFLLPSLFEGLPVTLMETQASGLPALASDRVTREMDKVGLIRFLPLEEDASCWAEAIANAGENKDRGLYAQKVLDAGYDISDQAQKLGAFYLRRHSQRKDK
ncbi:MAG: glycosyltransferase [Clostridia bacterium]|nr:glycosyltransferase [Clostridia bacterium]